MDVFAPGMGAIEPVPRVDLGGVLFHGLNGGKDEAEAQGHNTREAGGRGQDLLASKDPR